MQFNVLSSSTSVATELKVNVKAKYTRNARDQAYTLGSLMGKKKGPSVLNSMHNSSAKSPAYSLESNY